MLTRRHGSIRREYLSTDEISGAGQRGSGRFAFSVPQCCSACLRVDQRAVNELAHTLICPKAPLPPPPTDPPCTLSVVTIALCPFHPIVRPCERALHAQSYARTHIHTCSAPTLSNDLINKQTDYCDLVIPLRRRRRRRRRRIVIIAIARTAKNSKTTITLIKY